MTWRTHATTLAMFALAVAISFAASAQTTVPPAKPHDMAHMDMSSMMTEPHHVLAMAHMQNVRTFAIALRMQAESTTPLNAKFARAAVSEMDRSVDEMEAHHDAHVNAMSADMRTHMAEMVKTMETHCSMIEAAVDRLEKDVKAGQSDAKQVAAHAADLLKHLDAMSKMRP